MLQAAQLGSCHGFGRITELQNHGIKEPQNHRIIRWFVLEGTFKMQLHWSQKWHSSDVSPLQQVENFCLTIIFHQKMTFNPNRDAVLKPVGFSGISDGKSGEIGIVLTSSFHFDAKIQYFASVK